MGRRERFHGASRCLDRGALSFCRPSFPHLTPPVHPSTLLVPQAFHTAVALHEPGNDGVTSALHADPVYGAYLRQIPGASIAARAALLRPVGVGLAFAAADDEGDDEEMNGGVAEVEPTFIAAASSSTIAIASVVVVASEGAGAGLGVHEREGEREGEGEGSAVMDEGRSWEPTASPHEPDAPQAQPQPQQQPPAQQSGQRKAPRVVNVSDVYARLGAGFGAGGGQR
jgi:hypothetical protein